MLPKPLVQAPWPRERTSTMTTSSPRRATTSSSRYESRRLVATMAKPRSLRKCATACSAPRPLAVRLRLGAALVRPVLGARVAAAGLGIVSAGVDARLGVGVVLRTGADAVRAGELAAVADDLEVRDERL